LRLLALLVWAGLFGAGVLGVLARAWPGTAPLDDAAAPGEARLVVEWLAIMGETFALHVAACVAVALVFAVGTRRRGMALVSVGLGVLLAWPEAVAALSRRGVAPASEVFAEKPRGAEGTASVFLPARTPADGVLTVLSSNVLVWERDERPLLALIERYDPDVVLFQEWTEQWENRAGAALDAKYPHRVLAIGQGAFGQRVSSRLEFVGEPVLYPLFAAGKPWRDPQVRCVVEVGGERLTIQCVHLLAPTYQDRFAGMREQREQVIDLAGWCGREGGAVVMVGDYNFTPRGAYGGMLRAAGMEEAHDVAGSGRGATWPRVGMLRRAPGIRIDQCYVKGVEGVVGVEGSWVLGDIGSDHAPVLFRLKVGGAQRK
jgi:endonuclease/exonuclease/phosphatase (EEP) superfamily protein YafD